MATVKDKSANQDANDLNKTSIEIYGQHYKIVGKASTNYMRLLSGYVDDKMKEISKRNPRLDITKIAVLAAVNIADEYFRLKEECDELLKILDEEKKG